MDGEKVKGVLGMQLSQRKYLLLLERKGIIPHTRSVSEAKSMFKLHSKSRDGYLLYGEFRDLMRKLNSSLHSSGIVASDTIPFVQVACSEQHILRLCGDCFIWKLALIPVI
jgi:hypothetical protein